jgi:hypothetical protein
MTGRGVHTEGLVVLALGGPAVNEVIRGVYGMQPVSSLGLWGRA